MRYWGSDVCSPELPELPFTPGLEFSCEVDALGAGVKGWAVGDAVLGGNRFGAMAAFCVVPAAALRRKPDRLGWEEAAAYGVAYLTAWVALVRCARVQAGEWVLVHGADRKSTRLNSSH